MEFAFIKQQDRQARYVQRARKARFYAFLTLLCLLGTSAATVWQDETFGPQIKAYTIAAIEEFEASTDENSASRKIVQAALSKLDL